MTNQSRDPILSRSASPVLPLEEPTQPISCTGETIWGLVAKQARIHPNRIAMIDGETEISYARLIERANDISSELAARGVEPGSLVGVCMPRTWELVATLLGVLQLGCAYVPLDPAYPEDRVHFMLKHSRAAAAIVGDNHCAALCEEVDALIRLGEVGNHKQRRFEGPSASDLAYVIYTSGSTGQPKGVAVEHRNLVAMSYAMGQLLDDEERDGILAAASVCFDTSVMEILGSLSLGGTMLLAENALELPKLPFAHKVRTCVMVPSAMQALLASQKLPEGIRCVVFGGEALKLSLVQQIQALPWCPRVVNAYGPTEDTVFSTTSENPKGKHFVTIGKSVPNSRAYILDDSRQPVAQGVAGELYLAGNKLARGYLYDEAHTKERFVELDPNQAIPETRLYRTGDLCRWHDNGEIEFLGRVDQQVKIRGYRIELGEIESVLETMPGIDAAAAAALDNQAGPKILAIYFVSQNAEVTQAAIIAYLAKRLPKYMVPQLVMRLDELPYLPNDKLDRKQLPSLDELRRSAAFHIDANLDEPHLEPSSNGTNRNARAFILSTIQDETAALLNFENPGQILPNQSFDSLGLDSLTSLELSSRLARALGQKLPPQAILKYPTPAALVNFCLHLMGNRTAQTPVEKAPGMGLNTLANLQSHIQSSHPPFQAAKASAWSATDKAKFVQEVVRMVNDDRRNPYSKIIRTGSASRGTVSDAYNDEEQEAIIWTTNLYLGLNRDQRVIEESLTALENFGTGMGTSAAASGLTDLHVAFEQEFAELVGKPSACLFPTGYTANVGVIAGILGNNDIVVIDQLCHASIVDGARLCGATIRTFQHNNAEDLESVLKEVASPYRTVLVAFEGVYSMGEGAAPVAKLARTAKQYGALVLVDEAHSFGFYGRRGSGICADQGVTEQVDFIMTTLSKSLGSIGGIIAASEEHVFLLKSSARAYIFQASISPADMAAALTALRRIREDDSLRERLWDTTRYMRQQFTQAGYDLGIGDGPIVTPHFRDKDKLYAVVQGMYERGIQTSAVTYPIVEPGRGRLRFICSASHTRDDVDKTLAALMEADREFDAQITIPKTKSKNASQDPSNVGDWVGALSVYLEQMIAKSPWPVPDLAVSIKIFDQEIPTTLLVHQQVVSSGIPNVPDIPTCLLHLTDSRAIAALCSSDVQALLQTICEGTCILSGQVEPFIWFIARIVDWQREGAFSRSLADC